MCSLCHTIPYHHTGFQKEDDDDGDENNAKFRPGKNIKKKTCKAERSVRDLAAASPCGRYGFSVFIFCAYWGHLLWQNFFLSTGIPFCSCVCWLVGWLVGWLVDRWVIGCTWALEVFCRTSRISCLLSGTCPIRIGFSLHFTKRWVSHGTDRLSRWFHWKPLLLLIWEVTRTWQPTNSSAQPELTDQVTFTIP